MLFFLKVIKADSFGHFFDSHIFMNCYMYKIKFAFLSYISLIISLAKEPRKKGKIFLP